MSDSNNIWHLYKTNLLLEDAESIKAQLINSYIKSKIGYDIRNKKSPENKELIDKYKKEIQPIIDKLEKLILDKNPKKIRDQKTKKLVLDTNPKNANLNDLPHLLRFYKQLESNPNRDSN
jgi:hypothetical protein